MVIENRKSHSLVDFANSQKSADHEEVPNDGAGHVTPHPSDVLDMPVDPNEPTYCLCHQVSYGEMIGCDNPDVRIVPSQRAIQSSIIIFKSNCILLSAVPHRMVSFRMRGSDSQAEGQMVLPEMYAQQEEKVTDGSI